MPTRRAPWLTLAILGLLAAVFAAELVFAIEPTHGLLEPGVRTLLAFGGLQYTATVGSDEWYRMFLAPLMHTGLVHLLINGIALFVAGRILEPAIGARWFAALFVVSALAGSTVSLMINERTTVSVGASGAIMGLFAAMLVLSSRFAVSRSSLCPDVRVGPAPACLSCGRGPAHRLIPWACCAPPSANREGPNDLGSVRLFSAARAGLAAGGGEVRGISEIQLRGRP
jgi:membrane associated rhomboid family serine protease